MEPIEPRADSLMRAFQSPSPPSCGQIVLFCVAAPPAGQGYEFRPLLVTCVRSTDGVVEGVLFFGNDELDNALPWVQQKSFQRIDKQQPYRLVSAPRAEHPAAPELGAWVWLWPEKRSSSFYLGGIAPPIGQPGQPSPGSSAVDIPEYPSPSGEPPSPEEIS